jgi:hypothetical protein
MFGEEAQLRRIEQKVDKIMAAQDDINAAVTTFQGLLTDASAQVQKIGALLAAGGTPADTSALNSLVGQVPAVQASLDALANPAPVTTAPAGTGSFQLGSSQ